MGIITTSPRGVPAVNRRMRWLLFCVLVAFAIVGGTFIASQVASATVTNFCAKVYGSGEFCNQGHFHDINWIEAVASDDAFCVMRAAEGWTGAPSASGIEYCASASSGGFVYQEFHGLGGYAQTHNRHSFAVSASPAFEYSLKGARGTTQTEEEIDALFAVPASVAVVPLLTRGRAGGSAAVVPTTPAPASSTGVSKRFAVLRGPAGQGVPKVLADALLRVPAKLAVDLAGTRYVRSARAWLVPGRGWLCIAAEGSDGIGMACGTASVALDGRLVFVERNQSGNRSHILGLAPDGSAEARGERPDGTIAASASIHENVYRMVGSDVDKVSAR